MRATFLVELDTDDLDLATQAVEMQDALLDSGFNALSVKPWARQGTQSSLTLGQSVPTPPVAPAN